MNHRLAILAVAMSGLIGCGPRGMLEVEVVEAESARPIQGAIVEMRPISYFNYSPSVPSATTDEHGLVIFRPPHYWRYEVTAEFEGYIVPDRHDVSVDEEGRTYISEGGYARRADIPGETRRLRIEMKRDENPKYVPRTKVWGGDN